MATSQGLSFLSGVMVFAALSFFSPLQNPGVELYVHCSDIVFLILTFHPLYSWERVHNTAVTYGITRGCLATVIQFVYFISVRVTTLYDLE